MSNTAFRLPLPGSLVSEDCGHFEDSIQNGCEPAPGTTRGEFKRKGKLET
jgi:hypothetical protein